MEKLVLITFISMIIGLITDKTNYILFSGFTIIMLQLIIIILKMK